MKQKKKKKQMGQDKMGQDRKQKSNKQMGQDRKQKGKWDKI